MAAHLTRYLSSAGSDLDDGSLLHPWRTLARANAHHQSYNGSNALDAYIAQSVVHLMDAGPFDSCAFDPRPFLGSGRLIIAGDEFVDLAGFQLSAVDGAGMYLNITASGAPLDNYINKTLEMTSGICNGFRRMLRGHQPKLDVIAASTSNLVLTGAQTVDGVAVVAGNRVLAKDQAVPTENGIYVVAAGAWPRAKDADSRQEVHDAKVLVTAGTANAERTFFQIAYAPIPGTTPMVWTQTDAVVTPVFGVQTLAGALPAVGDTFSIREPLAEIVLPSTPQATSDYAANAMFSGFPKHGLSRSHQGAFLVNVKLTGSAPVAPLYMENSGVTMHGVSGGANVTVLRSHSSLYLGKSPGNNTGGWQTDVFGTTDALAWTGWGASFLRPGALNGQVESSVFGFANLNFHAQGTGSQSVSQFIGGRFTNGSQYKQGDITLQNVLIIGSGILCTDNARLALFEDNSIPGSSVLVAQNTDYVLHAGNNGQVFIRTGALSGHSSQLGMDVREGGTISFHVPVEVTGDVADVRLNKGDFAASFFSAAGNGVIDDVPPMATGGRVRRTA